MRPDLPSVVASTIVSQNPTTSSFSPTVTIVGSEEDQIDALASSSCLPRRRRWRRAAATGHLI